MIVNFGTILGSIYAETTVKFHSDQTTPNPYLLVLIFRVIWCWDALLLSKYGLSSNAVFHVGHVVYNSTVPIISMDSVSLYPGIDITASSGYSYDLMTADTPCRYFDSFIALEWRHNGRDGVSNHQPHQCLLDRLFRRRSKKISKLSVTGLCAGNSPVTAFSIPCFPLLSDVHVLCVMCGTHTNFIIHFCAGISRVGIALYSKFPSVCPSIFIGHNQTRHDKQSVDIWIKLTGNRKNTLTIFILQSVSVKLLIPCQPEGSILNIFVHKGCTFDHDPRTIEFHLLGVPYLFY